MISEDINKWVVSQLKRCFLELLDIGASGIHVAEYWTDLPPLDVFERKLQEIVLEAKNQYEAQEIIEGDKVK